MTVVQSLTAQPGCSLTAFVGSLVGLATRTEGSDLSAGPFTGHNLPMQAHLHEWTHLVRILGYWSIGVCTDAKII